MRAYEQIVKEANEFKEWQKSIQHLKHELLFDDKGLHIQVWADEDGNKTVWKWGVPIEGEDPSNFV